MNHERDLTDQLRRLAAALPSNAGRDVELRLTLAFRARHQRKGRLWMYAVAALFALIAVFAGLKMMRRERPADDIYNAPGFIALPYADSGVPMESAVVIRVRMRSSELASMGVALSAQPASAKISADLLVGQDGVPRAVRLVE